ncbi:unnamed protein product [Periconia digitata]|uniref:Putative gamma-glutamylcyclotransferase n=1 Tax=Periconia digitata TaxID=1303443 RepID=A0A9W4U7V0_9PLEO|nr:unnamed protein product [Periconia digitata]
MGAQPHTAFFYGTLMSPTVLALALQAPKSKDLNPTPAVLPAYTRRRVQNAAYPAIIPSTSSHSVQGMLISGLSDADIKALDRFEGDEYQRVEVKVRVVSSLSSASSQSAEGEGEEVEAETYIWIAGEDHLEDEEWDFERFVKEEMGGFLAGEGL